MDQNLLIVALYKFPMYSNRKKIQLKTVKLMKEMLKIPIINNILNMFLNKF